MTDLFISYARADSALVLGSYSMSAVLEELQNCGYKIWLDSLNIPGGTLWETEIKKGIEHAKYVLLLATENAAKRPYVHKEISIAQNHNPPIPIVPIFLDENHLRDLGFQAIQGIDFRFPFAVAMAKLVQAIPNAHPVKGRLYRDDLPSLLDSGEVTFREAESRWRNPLVLSAKDDAPVGLLLDHNALGMSAFLVGYRPERLIRPETVQVFLQFTDKVEESSFKTFLEYVKATGKPLWTILLRAPIRLVDDGREFSLSDTDSAEWEAAVNFIMKTLPLGLGTCSHVEFYMQSPVALVMALALRSKFKFQSDVYHFRRGNIRKNDRYRLVFSHTPK